MKKLLTLALAALLSLALVSGALAAGKTQVFVCGTNGVGDTQSIAHENFAAALNETGLFDAIPMVSSEMGSTDDVLEQGMAGGNVVAATDPARIAAYVPEIGILMMPYMFDSYDDLDSLLTTALYKEWQDKLYDQGLVLLTNNCITGFRSYITNKEVVKPEDLNGLKIRTMGSQIALDSINAMGAIATPLNQSEAYNAIQTKIVDGGEWQIPTIYSLRLYEVCKNLSLTKHFLLTGSIVCGRAWFDTLTEEQQTAMRELAVQEYGKTKELVLEYEDKFVAEMEAQGVKVNEADLDAFREATASLYENPTTTGGVDFLSLREELYKQMGIEK